MFTGAQWSWPVMVLTGLSCTSRTEPAPAGHGGSMTGVDAAGAAAGQGGSPGGTSAAGRGGSTGGSPDAGASGSGQDGAGGATSGGCSSPGTLCWDFEEGVLPAGWAPYRNEFAGQLLVDETR